MKIIKCDECTKEIPSFQKAYFNCKMLCQDCYERERLKNKKKKTNNYKINEFWKRWTKQ